jgi:hypothetical protein
LCFIGVLSIFLDRQTKHFLSFFRKREPFNAVVSNDLFREPIRAVDCNLVQQFKIDPRYLLSSPCQFFSNSKSSILYRSETGMANSIYMCAACHHNSAKPKAVKIVLLRFWTGRYSWTMTYFAVVYDKHQENVHAHYGHAPIRPQKQSVSGTKKLRRS